MQAATVAAGEAGEPKIRDVNPPRFERKIHDPAALEQWIGALARPLVFTNGVFDLLHRGHVTYLARARALGAGLLVALNSDGSARRLEKGAERPLNPLADRLAVLAALECVDAVTWFDEDTPVELLAQLRPQVYVKGGDYDMRQLAETALVESYGGRALAIPFVDGYSTTNLVKRIKGA